MMKTLLRIIVLIIFFTFSKGVFAQQLYVPDLRYTTYNIPVWQIPASCYGGELKPYVNGVELNNYVREFCAYGFCRFGFPFGTLKVGDVVVVKDACGNTSNSVTVSDDYVYIEVPAGSSYSGNNIGPLYESLPYEKLTTPIQIGKCENISINSHALHTFSIGFSPNASVDHNTYTSGIIKFNGAPITAADVDATTQGYPGAMTQVNSDGTLTYKENGLITYKTPFSGRVPAVLEYQGNGVNPFFFEMGMGPLIINVSGAQSPYTQGGNIRIEEKKYDGSTVTSNIPGDFDNALLKITFDSGSFKFYINGELKKTVARTVAYSASSGIITEAGELPYATGTTWKPNASGAHYVQAVIDGIRVVRQQFIVAEDLVIQESITNSACQGQTPGSIQVNVLGGKPPYSYSRDNINYLSNSIFTGLAAGTYPIYVKDASGCVATKNITVGSTPILTLAATPQPASCSNASNGSVVLVAQGGAGGYQYKMGSGAYQTSNQFVNLSPGAYTFWVKDNAGCETSINSTVNVSSNFTINAIGSSPTCSGGSNGSIIITSSGTANGPIAYSLDNISFQTSSTFSNLSAGTYTVYAKDNSCVISNAGIILTQPSPLVLNGIQSKRVSCFGQSDGSILATPVGGSGSYLYATDGLNYSTTPATSFSMAGLMAGNYKVWVRDIKGCTANEIITVTQPTPITLSMTSKMDVACFGASTGSITPSVTGGNSGITYFINTQSYTTTPISNLPAGGYTLIAKDSLGCQASLPFDILQPTDLQLSSPFIKNVSCKAGNNGEITISATGGTGTLLYNLSNSVSYQNLGTFTTLTAGNYVIKVQDSNGCTKTSANINVAEPTALSLTVVSKTIPLCFGNSDGVIDVIANQGTPPYTYSKDGNFFNTSNRFTGFSSGNYTIFAKDGNNCLTQTSVSLGQPAQLTTTAALVSNVNCYGGRSGSIQTTTKGGTAGYQYHLGNGIWLSGGTTQIFDTLAVGNYTVNVRDANGCTTTSISINVSQPTELLAQISSQSPVGCFGQATGRIQVSGSGGTPAYSYAINQGAFNTSNTFSDLISGTYFLHVKDSKGCTKSISTEVTQPAEALKINLVTQNNLKCSQDNSGSIQIIHKGGTAPYQSWIESSVVKDGGSPIFTNLAAGTYVIHGRDANGCATRLDPITLTQPTNINIVLLEKEDVNCDYYTKGRAKFLASGSYEGFSYTLSGKSQIGKEIAPLSSLNGEFTGISTGTYELIATDSRGCTASQSLGIVSKNSTIRFNTVATLPTNCLSQDGSIQIRDITGGRPPYLFSISSNPVPTIQSSFLNLLNGSYIVTVSDSLCTYNKAVDLRLPSSIQASYTVQPVNCLIPNGTLTFAPVTGGNGNFEFSKSGGTFSSNSIFTNLAPAIYSFVVRDNPLSCQTTVSIDIKEQNRSGLTFVNRIPVACNGQATGIIEVTADHNVSPFTFSLDKVNFGNSPKFTNLSAGVYTIYSRNSWGCLDSLKTQLTQPSLLSFQSSVNNNLCFGDTKGSISVYASGGVTPYTYQNGNTSNPQSLNLFESLAANNYLISVIDANGCRASQSISVTQPSELTLQPVYSNPVRCYGESNGKVDLLARGGVPTYSYSIDDKNYIYNSSFDGLLAGRYSFSVKDNNGCLISKVLDVYQPDSLKLSIVSQGNPLCANTSTGNIKLKSTGGNGGYLYSVTSGLQQVEPIFSGLADGMYFPKVVDSKGCVYQLPNLNLTQPNSLSHTFQSTQPTCYGGSNGKITILASGGVGKYKLTSENQSLKQEPVNSSYFNLIGLKSSDYSFILTDSNACQHSFKIKLSQPLRLTTKAEILENKCFGDSTGIINLFGQGATPPYKYSVFNKLNTADTVLTAKQEYKGLIAGAYLVKLQDANVCTHDTLITVRQPEKLRFDAILTDSVSCYGLSDGRVSIRATGGTGAYSYSSSNKQYQMSSILQNLSSNVYKLWVKDANGCAAQLDSFWVAQPRKLSLTVGSAKNPLCNGESNGTIQLKTDGGNNQYRYYMDNKEFGGKDIFSGLAQGSYTFKVVDWKGCSDTLSRVLLKWPSSLQARLDTFMPICTDDSNGKITILPTGGTPNYTTKLLKGNIEQWPLLYEAGVKPDTSGTFFGLKSGSYLASIEDSNGCQLLLPTQILPPQTLNTAINLGGKLRVEDSVTVCQGQSIQLNALNPNKNITWYKDGKLIPQTTNQEQITVSTSGVYKVEIRNETGCMVSDSFNLKNSNKALQANFLLPTQAFVGDTIVCLDITKPIPDKVEWKLPSVAIPLAESFSKITSVIGAEGEYTYTMKAFKGECIGEIQHRIRIKNTTRESTGTSFIIHKFDISPNPNYGVFKVLLEFNRATNVKIKIVHNLSGKLIYSTEKQNLSKVSEDMMITTPGLYVVTVYAEGLEVSKRVLILE